MNKKYWLVYTGKEEYKLTDSQYKFMKSENTQKGTTIFWFDDFTISLPHVTSMKPSYEQIDELPQLPEQSPLERDKARERIKEIKEKLFAKLNSSMTPNEEIERRALLKEQASRL